MFFLLEFFFVEDELGGFDCVFRVYGLLVVVKFGCLRIIDWFLNKLFFWIDEVVFDFCDVSFDDLVGVWKVECFL